MMISMFWIFREISTVGVLLTIYEISLGLFFQERMMDIREKERIVLNTAI